MAARRRGVRGLGPDIAHIMTSREYGHGTRAPRLCVWKDANRVYVSNAERVLWQRSDDYSVSYGMRAQS